MLKTEVTAILAFLNTLTLIERSDQFSHPDGVAMWVRRSTESPDWEASLHDTAQIIEFREALRELVAVSSTGFFAPGAAETLARIARSIPIRLDLRPDGKISVTPQGTEIERAIGFVLASVSTAMAEGSWSRIKICRNPACRSAFYDRSRNHSAVWCRMAECGNLMKARRFRQRTRRGTAG
jgi:predicted RNA-binding Zn ribbon-like protein